MRKQAQGVGQSWRLDDSTCCLSQLPYSRSMIGLNELKLGPAVKRVFYVSISERIQWPRHAFIRSIGTRGI